VLPDGRAVATRRHAKPETWLEAVEFAGDGSAETAALTPRERAEEMLMMSLRLAEGLDIAALVRRTGVTLDELAPPARRAPLAEEGLLTEDACRLTATRRGRAVLSALTAQLLA
jgi:oxygen-independent coproporphyrinogen-3 oxidase